MTPATDPESVRRILLERARALARPPEVPESGESVALLVLGVAPERYGVEIGSVEEVAASARPAPVPGAPQLLAGLLNVRGRLHWVLDLGRYLGQPDGEPGVEREAVVLVSAGDVTVGLLVDGVRELRRVAQADLRPPLGRGGRRPGIVKGVTPDLISVLDVAALLADPELAAGEPGGERGVGNG